MKKLLLFSLFTASTAFATVGTASAMGGMGDTSAHIKEMNAICDLQRRGEAPPNPNMCLPEYPPGAVESEHARRGY